jgi:hypothetical protein
LKASHPFKEVTVNKLSVLLATLLVFMLAAGTAAAQELVPRHPPDSPVTSAPDLVLVRPLATLGAVVTSSVFGATLPLTYPLGLDQKAVGYLVEKPWEYVANRPLGVFVPEPDITVSIDNRINGQYTEFLSRTGADRTIMNLR